jgi:Fe-S oxidoreductase
MLGFEPPENPLHARVTYQDACHLAHAQRIREAPRRLLGSIPGLELVEMTTPDRCCGSAGLYSITQSQMSRRLLEDKMDDIEGTGCEIIAAANPGCMLQLEFGVRLREGNQRVSHLIEILDHAYEEQSDQ